MACVGGREYTAKKYLEFAQGMQKRSKVRLCISRLVLAIAFLALYLEFAQAMQKRSKVCFSRAFFFCFVFFFLSRLSLPCLVSPHGFLACGAVDCGSWGVLTLPIIFSIFFFYYLLLCGTSGPTVTVHISGVLS